MFGLSLDELGKLRKIRQPDKLWGEISCFSSRGGIFLRGVGARDAIASEHALRILKWAAV